MSLLGRAGTLVMVCLALAACSAANTFGNKESKFSRRIVEEGEPVPKGGGTYKVGQSYQVNGRIYTPAENPRYRAEGIASWYGPDFHGRETANGEVYDMHAISAAHPTMPIPSYARVTNLENGRSIIVRVNDRGPYAANRIIDLSIGTAKALDFYSRGLARVRVEYVGRAPIEGSDDKMLLATLRNGSPAPAPSLVMLAAAKPMVPAPTQVESVALRGSDGTPIPAERPYGLGVASGGSGPMLATTSTTERKGRAPARVPERSAATSAAAPTSASLSAVSEARGDGRLTTPTAAFAPVQGLGLMSGRGLY